MAAASPLDHDELRHIEKSLDEGKTAEAAQLLAPFANSREHELAITFLATRLLFERGRIDAAGAADRLTALLERTEHFPEAEDWLAELEGRTERSALGEAAEHPPVDAEPEEETSPSLPAPPSHAPSVPRRAGAEHPYLDDIDEEVTPAESPGNGLTSAHAGSSDSSEPPPLPEAAYGAPRGEAPPAETRPSQMPTSGNEQHHPRFDSLRAKERLSLQAGRYRANSQPDQTRAEFIDSVGPSARPSVAPDIRRNILEAWELALAGRLDAARALLPEEPSPLDLDPEVRVALARVLLELGQPERASAEASRALEAAPTLAEARLMLVWSAVRHARARDDNWSLDRAARLLKESSLGPVTEPGLVDALTACIEARIGTPVVALQLAQRALRWNAESIDGLAALAEAASLCREERRAEVALERLFSVSESAAEQIAPRLRRLGVGEHGPTSSASVWLPLEHALSSGARDIALEGLETLGNEKLSELTLGRVETREAAGRSVSEFFTLAPILRHFGQYDLSIASIERLDVALGLLYGGGPRALDVAGSSSALWQLGGLYLGETLRQCCAGRWQPGADLKEAGMLVNAREVKPFQIVRNRIAHGRHATLASALERVLDDAPRTGQRWEGARALTPALPWGDREWPPLEDLPRLGRALGHSVVAVYAAQQGAAVLDRTLGSLPALDRYLSLVAPGETRLTEDSAWARWLCVFLGAYVGEVLCKEFGGVWVGGDGSGAHSLAVQVGTRRIAPLLLILETLNGRAQTTLRDFAADLERSLEPSDHARR